jgi:enoyl-CoA hydratase
MTVQEERDGAITVVTIDRPRAHNAVDHDTAVALAAAIERFADEDEASVLVLTGSGPTSFCAGADLKGIPQLLGDDEFCTSVGPMGFAKLDPGKPTIAAINGYCFAGGLELAAWCDFRIAEEQAEFGALNRRWGVPFFDGGTQRLPRILGLSNALWLMESGVRIDVQRAHELGFVQEVVPTGHALARAVELARYIAGYPQASVRSDRRSILDSGGHGLSQGLALEDDARRRSLSDGVMLDRLQAFAHGDRPTPPSAS